MNDDTANSLIKELEKYGVKVYTSREDDIYLSLSERSQMANSIENLDCFISIHHNAANSNVNRGEVIFSIKDNKSQELAKYIEGKLYSVGNEEVKVYSRTNSRGTDYYGVLRGTKAPSVIVEVSFITSEEGLSLVDTLEKRQQNGILIAHGILDYLGIDYSEEKETKEPKEEEKVESKKENNGLSIIKKVLSKNKNSKGYQRIMEILNR